MKDFGQWLADTGKGETEEVDDTVWLECTGCGKSECCSIAQVEAGDAGWYVEEEMKPGETYLGYCCGNPFCLP